MKDAELRHQKDQTNRAAWVAGNVRHRTNTPIAGAIRYRRRSGDVAGVARFINNHKLLASEPSASRHGLGNDGSLRRRGNLIIRTRVESTRIEQGGVAMLRVLAVAVTFALAVPSVAVAQEHHPNERKPVARPFVQPHGPPPAVLRGPARGGAQFGYRGRMVNRVHLAPFVYPHGYGYRRWGVGGMLPPIFLASAYFYAEWATLGLAPPEPGFQWVRYGPDLLLVNTSTGQVVDAVYGAFY